MTLLGQAMDAYLSPLLKKHNAGQYITWEDLEASRVASNLVLKQSQPFNPFVSKRLDDLHQSQVNAYREAARKAIQEWALAFPLEPMEEGDSEQTFVDRCVSALVFVPTPTGTARASNTTTSTLYTWPNWKLNNAKALASNEIRKRAREIYEKYHPINEEEGDNDENNNDPDMVHEGEVEDVDSDDEVDDEDNDDDHDVEEGEEEDGEVDTTAGTRSTGAKTTAKQQLQKKNNNRNKRKTGNPKTATVSQKNTNAKAYRKKKGQAARGGRRGGRAAGGNQKTS